MNEGATPLMRQYHAIKQQAPHALLMFRLGDFYELFYDDAVTASRELEITLTSRHKDKGDASAVPMCGVPYHAAEGYIAKLIQRGYRVAICDQVEDPRFAKKLVRREITRIVTPGTATESTLLRSGENNYLAALAHAGTHVGLALVDVSTGEFRTTELNLEETAPALEQYGAREVLIPAESRLLLDSVLPALLRTPLEPWIFTADYAERNLREHFKLLTLEGCGLAGRTASVCAAGAILHYVRETQRSALNHLDAPTFFERSAGLVLDAVTVRNLELLEPLFAADAGAGKGSVLRQATLLSVIDQTHTGMGSRLLRQRLLAPSVNRQEIEARLEAVQELLEDTIGRTEIQKQLGGVLDLERLLAKVTIGSAGPREMLALGRSLDKAPGLRLKLEPRRAARFSELRERLDEVPAVRDGILGALNEEPPVNLNDLGAIRDGFNVQLDELRDISRNSRQYIAEIEVRERKRTGIASLKVRFNNVFGYYIEISKANLHLAPPDYDRKQTLVNAERFTMPELKVLEEKILAAEEKMLELEREIFAGLRQSVIEHVAPIKQTAAAVAELDVTASLAQVAAENRYTRPKLNDTGEITIVAGRHPVIEKLTEREATRFIPNDLYLDSDQKLIALITGPNMGGKSTYLRQTALICLLAQMGSFVPAESASLPLLDRIFTRIGASDNLARGRSTFMVEMTETAVILNTATPRSLIVLDEIGRGTATYDGLALAWAVVEYIHQRTRAKTLFATHYHELTELADQFPGVVNLCVSVKEAGDQIIFLRKVEPGRADRSYGIEVARLAGLPHDVIVRAREILAYHERSEHTATEELAPKASRKSHPLQIQLFEPVNYQIADRIRRLQIDTLRPIEALQVLSELQEELKRQQ
jgi:DNA mismatch repair protein MutS